MIKISNLKKYRFTILKFFIFSLIMAFIFKNNHLLKDSLNKTLFLEDYYTFLISTILSTLITFVLSIVCRNIKLIYKIIFLFLVSILFIYKTSSSSINIFISMFTFIIYFYIFFSCAIENFLKIFINFKIRYIFLSTINFFLFCWFLSIAIYGFSLF